MKEDEQGMRTILVSERNERENKYTDSINTAMVTSPRSSDLSMKHAIQTNGDFKCKHSISIGTQYSKE